MPVRRCASKVILRRARATRHQRIKECVYKPQMGTIRQHYRPRAVAAISSAILSRLFHFCSHPRPYMKDGQSQKMRRSRSRRRHGLSATASSLARTQRPGFSRGSTRSVRCRTLLPRWPVPAYPAHRIQLEKFHMTPSSNPNIDFASHGQWSALSFPLVVRRRSPRVSKMSSVLTPFGWFALSAIASVAIGAAFGFAT